MVNEATEPLLQDEDNDDFPPSGRLQWFRDRRFYICIFLLKFTLTFYTTIFDLPLVRLVERAVCVEYYKAQASGPDWQDVQENMCKIVPIQNKLAYVLGFRLSFYALPGLLTSLVYGILSDHYGRKPIIALICLGECLGLSWILVVCYSNTTLRIELVWLESLFYFIGGGPNMLFAMVYTMVADHVPTYLRSRTIFFLHATSYVVRITSLLVSSALIDTHLSFPFLLAFGFLGMQCLLVLVIPETASKIQRSSPALAQSPTEDTEDSRTEPRSQSEAAATSSSHSNTVSTAPSPLTVIQRITALLKHRGIRTIIGAFIIKRIAYTSAGETFIYQYASERFKMRLSQTFVVRLMHLLGALIVTLVLMPIATYIWHSRQSYCARRDLWTLRGNMMAGIAGFVTLYSASNLEVLCLGMFFCGLGEGLEGVLQAMGSYFGGESLHSSFFALITTVDTIAGFVSGPIMAALFSLRNAEGYSTGYCFLLSLVLYIVLFLTSLALPI